jgi:MFS family permease
MAVAAPRAATSAEPGFNEKMLFWASFFTLIAAGIGFSVRGAILKDWGGQFGFTQSELGAINGGGLFGFGMTIIVLSFFADRVGYGRLMLLAFVLYVASAVVTFAATYVYATSGKEGAYWCLYIGAWLFSLANGTCETVINPLTATLFPKNKTHWLNILHAGWPGGLVLGALIQIGFEQAEQGGAGAIRWEYKLGVFLAPVLLFGIMMFNRPFPRSEAKAQGVSMKQMMGEVGFLGAGVAVFFLGLLLSTVLIPAIPKSWVDIPKETQWAIGWGTALVVWIIYAFASGFRLGHLVLAFLYILHALVGYVELGTDSWITNVGNTVLSEAVTTNAQTWALGAFICTNLVMFGLRFFAGPIVHKISPLGLLFVSALLGTLGLVLFSQPFIKGVALWYVVSIIYAVGKTFYWPTLLGVISERFPRGGALALGFSGGIGMLSAGLLGGPGIGYKQDFFAVQNIQENNKDTYLRYVARRDDGSLDDSGRFPLVTDLFPERVPPVAGLDNAKLKVADDFAEVKAGRKTQTTLESELARLEKDRSEGRKVEEQLDRNLHNLKKWWESEGKPHFETDIGPLREARTFGARMALLYTAAVPAAMAIGFLLLVLVFKLQGGYQQVHLEEQEAPAEY